MTDAFASKMSLVLEHAACGESEAAYREINAVFDKKKGLTKMTANQASVASFIKAFCQVRLNLYGDADKNYDTFVKAHKIFPDEGIPYLRVFTVLATHLKRTKEAKAMLEELAKLRPQDTQVSEYLLFISLADWDLMSVQRQYMKMYKETTSLKDYVASIATQYLNLAREKDEYLGRADPNKVKILQLILNKADADAANEKDKEAGKAAQEQLLHLRGEVLWDMKDYKALLTLFLTKLQSGDPNVYEFSEYLGPLEQLASDDSHFQTYRSEIESVFLQGLEAQLKRDTPVASYAPQQAFLVRMLQRTSDEELKQVEQQLHNKTVSTLVAFVDVYSQVSAEEPLFWPKVLRLLALYIQKLMVVQKDKFRSKNYLMHLLQILEVLQKRLQTLSEVGRSLVSDVISILVGWGKHTLTVVDELQGFKLFRKQLLEAVTQELGLMSSDKDVGTRVTLEYQEMCLRFMVEIGDGHTIEEGIAIQWVNKFLAKYEEYEPIFYKDQEKIKLEKGERLLHDNYLLGAVELLRVIENRQKPTAEGYLRRSQIHVLLYLLLEFGKRSIYNFDLMLRHTEVNQSLCLFEENSDLFIKHDVKGNQYDTLAYLFYKTVLAIPFPELSHKSVASGLDFFRECEKESIESFKKCCKHGNTKVLTEFYLYNKLIEHSVTRVIYDQVLAEQHLYFNGNKTSNHASNLQNSLHLLEKNLARLQSNKSYSLALNWDLVHVQPPTYFTTSVFHFDLAGVLKDQRYLRARSQLTYIVTKLAAEGLHALLGYLNKEVLEQTRTDVSGLSLAGVLEFSQYKVFRRVVNPLADAAGREPFHKDELSAQVESTKHSLLALLEFVENLVPFLGQDPTQTASTDFKKQSLSALSYIKQQTDKKIGELLMRTSEGAVLAFNSLAYFEVHQSLHIFKLIANTYNEIKNDLKNSVKKHLASRDETEKLHISSISTTYGELKDYIKQKQQALSSILDNLNFQQVVPELSCLNLADIKLPSLVAKNLPKLLETYRTKLRYSCADTMSRVGHLSKF